MKVRQIIYVCSVGLILGSFLGLANSVQFVLVNRYIQYKMYNIIIHVFQKCLNNGVFYAVLLLLGLYILYLLLVEKLQIERTKVILIYKLVVSIAFIAVSVDWMLREFSDLTLVYGIKDFKRMVSAYLASALTFNEMVVGIRKYLTKFFVFVFCGIIAIPIVYLLLKRLNIDNISNIRTKNIF